MSGGGSKGAFAVGVLKNLAANFPDINFDIFIGTSTGSLIAPFAALGQLEILEKLYTSITNDQVIIKGNVVARLLGSNSLFDATPLGNLIKQHYNEDVCNQVFRSGKQVFFATTCLQTGKAVNFSSVAPDFTSDYQVIKLNTADEMRRAVMASACQPVFMQPIEVNKGAVPLRQYVDGGVKEYAGIQLAIDAGADEIYAILLTPEKKEQEERIYNDSFSILQRTIDIFTAEVGDNDIRVPDLYNRALKYIDAVKAKLLSAGISSQIIEASFNSPFNDPFAGKRPLAINIIRPAAPLGGGPGGLNFDAAEMKAMLALGQRRIDDYMAGLNPSPKPVA